MTNQNYTIFYFAEIDRPAFINKHNFYVKEAKSRIFSQFNESLIEIEAQKIVDNYYEQAGEHFNPEYDDEGSILEQANFAGYSHWSALKEMKTTVSLALTAGMFHQFDKDLRKKCIMEFKHIIHYKIVNLMFWEISFPKLIELMEWIGMDIKDKPFYKEIDACHQLVNVYKHGDGNSHRSLSASYPKYYNNPLNVHHQNLHHDQLEVNIEQFLAFADAINDFWNNIPIHCFHSELREIPDWLETTCEKYKKKAYKIDAQRGSLPPF